MPRRVRFNVMRSLYPMASCHFHITRNIKNSKAALQRPLCKPLWHIFSLNWASTGHQISLYLPWDKREQLLKTQ